MAKKAKDDKTERAKSGKAGARRNPQDPADLIRMGKGRVKAMKPIACSPWKGAQTVGTPFDKEQADKNKALGYC